MNKDKDIKYIENIVNTETTITSPELDNTIDKNDIIISKSVKKNSYQIQKCKVISRLIDGKVIIDFNNLGLIVKSNAKVGDYLNIKYKGIIGATNFKFEVE